ncbi:MAG: sulfotransferase family 2 domain-containing protein [Flavobacteriales bacterium]|jgi:hypothetical protein|nr:sulfotransferase family 2 domain-containing protein [Flavobacteriales bacterium]MBT7623328.1 sulfotransferase family 2 domain-containing protein [Flavobacteriaceae bacterium]
MIEYLKDKYYWFTTYNKLSHFLKDKEDSILLFGYPKSGNTWFRLLIYNYLNLQGDQNLGSTISFDELNRQQNNVMDRGSVFLPENGFPLFYRTHKIYNRPYTLFNKKIFIHRNPLDTLISAYYFYKNRDIPFSDDPKNLREKLMDIDFYVSYKINFWIKYFRISLKKADIVMNYSDMKNDTRKELTKLVQFLNWDLDEVLIKKSVEFSLFNKVKKMGKMQSQQYGNGPKDGSFKGEFTRSGEEGQFYSKLKKETIDLVLQKFPEFKNLYPNLVE